MSDEQILAATSFNETHEGDSIWMEAGVREAIRLAREREWISVEDRLPEVDKSQNPYSEYSQEVLVLKADGKRLVDSLWYLPDGRTEWDEPYTKTTHWMSLPPNPTP